MKKHLQKIIIGCLICAPMMVNAQWGTLGTIGRTTPSTITGIGVGTFPSVPSLEAKLHVSSFYLASNSATNGKLFRTDGDQSVLNQWQLFTGTTATLSTEKFNISIPANDSSVTVKATISDLILEDNKNKIYLSQIVAMQQRIEILEQKLADFEVLEEQIKSFQSQIKATHTP